MNFFGIDYGTTNTALVGRYRRDTTYYHDGSARPIPSLIAVDQVSGMIAASGREAWDNREVLSEYCEILSSSKMNLGSDKVWRIGPELWSAERVATEIFKLLKKQVITQTGSDFLSEAVVSIPVGFSSEKRKALRKAALNAGINIKGFVSEPTAALFHSLDKVKPWPYLAVFDWGGGTLDISVVRTNGNHIHEIATVPKDLGGDVIDIILAEWVHSQIMINTAESEVPFSSMESRFKDKMLTQCENIKRMLTIHSSWFVSIPKYGIYGSVNIEITREILSQLISPIIEEALGALEEGVSNKAKIGFERLGCILMVGGSSHLYGLKEAINERGWSCEVIFPDDTEWHVATGATLLSHQFGSYNSSQNLGIKLSDDSIYPLIKKGEKITNNTKVVQFGITDDAKSAQVIFSEQRENENGSASHNDKILGYISVPTMGFSNEPIHIRYNIDEDLIFQAEINSDKLKKSDPYIWNYANLRFSFELPDELDSSL